MNAFHHFPDKPTFIAEAARVLAPGGALCTVGLDPHRGTPLWPVYEYFPGTLQNDLERYPSCEQIRAWLADAGFASPSSRLAQHIRSNRHVRSIAAPPRGASNQQLLSHSNTIACHETGRHIPQLRRTGDPWNWSRWFVRLVVHWAFFWPTVN